MNASESERVILVADKVDAFSAEICRFDRKERLVHLDCAIYAASRT